MADLSFIKNFEKYCDKMENVTSQGSPPRYWFGSGNYVLNYISSGDFNFCVPQGRITALAGPSGSGKSFIQCNIAAQAQQHQDAYVLMIDTENALDDEFVSKIGVDVEHNYNYKSVVTIDDTINLLSNFVRGYKESYGSDVDAPKVLIVVDSLDMLLTDSELKNFVKGENKGDQGQRAKQTKALLRNLVQQIKSLNISIVVTCQVYAATQEQILKGVSDGNWVINGAVKFSLSHLLLLTKLKLKTDNVIQGIKMKCQAVKTRFTKPFQDVSIDVPYESGMDPFSGLIEVGESLGIIHKKGSYKVIDGTDHQFYAKDVGDYASAIFERIDQLDDIQISTTGDYEEETGDSELSIEKRRKDTDRLKQVVADRKLRGITEE